MGRPRATQVYQLGKRDSLIVVAQLCPEFTARIVDRWQELEAQAAPAIVPKVLGEGVCEKFRTPYTNPQNGQTYSIYAFPKREACLMAMSYSYDLQAKVFDRMAALEAKVAQPAIPQTLPETLCLSGAGVRSCRHGNAFRRTVVIMATVAQDGKQRQEIPRNIKSLF